MTTGTPIVAEFRGITAAVVSAQQLPGSGLWIDQPHRVIAFGFLYITAWGISELYAHRWAAVGTKRGSLRPKELE